MLIYALVKEKELYFYCSDGFEIATETELIEAFQNEATASNRCDYLNSLNKHSDVCYKLKTIDLI